MKVVEPIWHEFHANVNFNEHGLAPYFAADRRVKDGGGSQSAEFTHDGERWEATLYFQSSNIVHPGPRTPGGAGFQLETVREFRIAVDRHEDEDRHGKQGFNAHLRPRWNGQELERDDGTVVDCAVPDGLGDGINVKITGSNVDAHRYLPLLRAAADAVGINDWYFSDPHQSSNIQDASREVRVQEDRSGPVHARDGPIAQMGHLLENDRDGYRKVVQNDRDERGRCVPGYYHTVTLAQKRVQEAFPDHDYAREVKHYYAREAASLDSSHPLSHPKVGAALQIKEHDGTVYLDDLDELQRQLDQTVLSVLADAGLRVDAGGPFVADAYFEPENVERPDDWLYGLDLTHIRQEQESVVVRYLVDNGISPIQWDALDRLVTDGGEVSPKDIADSGGWHPDAVRKALRKMEELLDREYGSVALRSPFIAEMVYDAVREAREANERVTGTVAKAIEAAEHGLDEATSAFIAWARKYDVDAADGRDARMSLRMGRDSLAEVKRQLRKGYELWTDAGRDPAQYRSAKVRFEDGSVAIAGRYLPR